MAMAKKQGKTTHRQRTKQSCGQGRHHSSTAEPRSAKISVPAGFRCLLWVTPYQGTVWNTFVIANGNNVWTIFLILFIICKQLFKEKSHVMNRTYISSELTYHLSLISVIGWRHMGHTLLIQLGCSWKMTVMATAQWLERHLDDQSGAPRFTYVRLSLNKVFVLHSQM